MSIKDERIRRLKVWQRQSGMTWKEVAKVCGYTSGAYFSQLMGGTRPFSEDVARSLESALKLPTGYLDGRDAEKTSVPPLFMEVAVGVACAFAKNAVDAEQMRKLLTVAYEDSVARGSMDAKHIKALASLFT